jgi:hypothetical protein
VRLVRPWCGLVRRCFRIEPIDPCDVGSGDEMTVGVYGDLNRAVAHLVFHVSQGSAVLDQQTPEGVSRSWKRKRRMPAFSSAGSM